MNARTTYFTHLECSKTAKVYPADRLQTFSNAGKPLLARYDFPGDLNPDILIGRPLNMWRYAEFLPVHKPENRITLGEGMTPILHCKRDSGLAIKDESINPTGSFKARGLAMAVARAKELGVKACVIPTAGNAGGAMSAYCALAGLEAHVYMPLKTPEVFKQECRFLGANLHIIDGTISDCAKAIAAQTEQEWFDVSTLKEPYRIEGKKTMGYEIAEQYAWDLPEVIIYPTGGGTGLIGIWKAFGELRKLGWLKGPNPRMVVVQTEGCCPIVDAWQKGESTAASYPNPAETIANGLRVPKAFGDEIILDILRQSEGCGVTVSEAEMMQGIKDAAQQEGILLAPEGAAVWRAWEKLSATGWIAAGQRTLLINTGSMYKYAENLE